MATGKKLQPIIIKRVKKTAHAAHGGAWKIAYADFVTAMMAFFLLMWLLGSTAKGELSGIASYFILDRQREAFARRVENRAAKASAAFEERKAREDED